MFAPPEPTYNVPTLPVPAVIRFPPVMLAVALNDVCVPILVIFGCAAVVNEPVTVVKLPKLAAIFPTLTLPSLVADPTTFKYVEPSLVICQVSVVSHDG